MATLFPEHLFYLKPQLNAQITFVNTSEAYKTMTKFFEIQLNPIFPLWFQGISQANIAGFLYFFWVPS